MTRVSSLAAAGRIMPSRWWRKDHVAYRVSYSPRHHGGGGRGGTYYDSQSGRHVSIHDETKISVYLRMSIHDEDVITKGGNDGLLKLMEDVTSMGAAGSILTLSSHRRPRSDDGDDHAPPDVHRFLEALSTNAEIAPGDLNRRALLIRVPMSLHMLSSYQPPDVPANVNLCCEYTDEGAVNLAILADASGTSIGIFDPKYYIDRDPISVASDVANIIDIAASDGSRGSSIPYIVLDPADPDAVGHVANIRDDEYVRLCEEISYLDVAGPTMKSRLVVSATNTDQIGECLDIGISKYIVDGVECLEMLRDVVDEAGKELILNNAIR